MTGLAEFLTARLGEDEAASREVHEARVCSGCSDGWEAGFDPDRCDCGYPARARRDAAAKRKILAYHNEVQRWSHPLGDGDQSVQEALAATVGYLATAYSDNPDYDPAWATS